MFKVTHAVITAALVAGLFTAATASGSHFSTTAASAPAVQTAAKTVKSCAGEPWPYNNCGAAQAGEQTIRVIKIN